MQGWVSVCPFGSPSLLFFCWRCKDRPGKCPYTSLKAPPLSLAPSLPFFGRKKEMKFFNYEPITVNKKNMHYSRSHWIIASNTWAHHPPKPPQHPQFNFEVNSSSLSLFSLVLSLSHTQSLSLSPRMPCRFVWLGTSPFTSFSLHYHHWADAKSVYYWLLCQWSMRKWII